MFSASAELYDLIYSGFKDYAAESSRVATIVKREHGAARTILDVACGTAEHARILAEQYGFEVDGLDLDPEFVAIAKRKLPHGSVYRGDMTSFTLPKKYDVILCLFSSIGYVKTLTRVRDTLERFRAHLAPRGIVLVEPWFAPDMLQPGRITVNDAESSGLRVVRMSQLTVEDRLSRIRFEYLIGRPNGIEHATEVHELGLFTTGELLDAFAAAGLSAVHDPQGLDGRGLFTARAMST